jgi:hypothetical protein
MLFLQDDLRIRSASYAVLPPLDLEKPNSSIRELEHLQAIVAYCYSAPRPTFDDLFLHFEQSSLAIFTPRPISIFLLRPEDHVEEITSNAALTPDEWHHVPGYQGEYNFRHPFWVAKGSRLYPPAPHLGLNISQDLSRDVLTWLESPQHHLLPRLLRRPATERAERVLLALTWYNRANALNTDDDGAIINLAIAFGALLALPRNDKSDRFVDAVSMLLGRVSRLNFWAEQFYNARSDVAHEGTTKRMHFLPVEKKKHAETLSRPLLGYGRRIFQLCVGALLFGAELADRAGLRDQLVTNQERLAFICKTLDDPSLRAVDRFSAIEETVALNE